MFVATLVSALVGGEVSGRDVICATVILEGLNVGKANLQPESMCRPPGNPFSRKTDGNYGIWNQKRKLLIKKKKKIFFFF